MEEKFATDSFCNFLSSVFSFWSFLKGTLSRRGEESNSGTAVEEEKEGREALT